MCCSYRLTGKRQRASSDNYRNTICGNNSCKHVKVIEIHRHKPVRSFNRVNTSVTIGIKIHRVWNGVSINISITFYRIKDAVIVVIKVN